MESDRLVFFVIGTIGLLGYFYWNLRDQPRQQVRNYLWTLRSLQPEGYRQLRRRGFTALSLSRHIVLFEERRFGDPIVNSSAWWLRLNFALMVLMPLMLIWILWAGLLAGQEKAWAPVRC